MTPSAFGDVARGPRVSRDAPRARARRRLFRRRRRPARWRRTKTGSELVKVARRNLVDVQKILRDETGPPVSPPSASTRKRPAALVGASVGSLRRAQRIIQRLLQLRLARAGLGSETFRLRAQSPSPDLRCASQVQQSPLARGVKFRDMATRCAITRRPSPPPRAAIARWSSLSSTPSPHRVARRELGSGELLPQTSLRRGAIRARLAVVKHRRGTSTFFMNVMTHSATRARADRALGELPSRLGVLGGGTRRGELAVGAVYIGSARGAANAMIASDVFGELLGSKQFGPRGKAKSHVRPRKKFFSPPRTVTRTTSPRFRNQNELRTSSLRRARADARPRAAACGRPASSGHAVQSVPGRLDDVGGERCVARRGSRRAPPPWPARRLRLLP